MNLTAESWVNLSPSGPPNVACECFIHMWVERAQTAGLLDPRSYATCHLLACVCSYTLTDVPGRVCCLNRCVFSV
eukprot:352239-Chlamydomonas_euryale.AAC.11